MISTLPSSKYAPLVTQSMSIQFSIFSNISPVIVKQTTLQTPYFITLINDKTLKQNLLNQRSWALNVWTVWFTTPVDDVTPVATTNFTQNCSVFSTIKEAQSIQSLIHPEPSTPLGGCTRLSLLVQRDNLKQDLKTQWWEDLFRS